VVVVVPANNLTATSVRLAFTFLVGVMIVVVRGIYRVQRFFQIVNLPNSLKHFRGIIELIFVPGIDAGARATLELRSSCRFF
jgi:hypothetical protein